MKYFIAYLLSGDAKARHDLLTRELFRRFKLTKTSPAHVTIKRPFLADEIKIKEIEGLLEGFSGKNARSQLKFSGFGTFAKEVVFVKVIPSGSALNIIASLDEELKKITWLDYDVFEVNRKLHATLAHNGKTKEKFSDILMMLSHERFHFIESLDNISILKKEDGKKWEIHKRYELK